MPYPAKRLGIVGATSYLGRRLIERLTAADQIELVLLSRNTQPIANRPVYGLDRFEDHVADLDCVIHLAAITDSRVPERDIRSVNVDLARAVAEAAAQAGVPRFVFLSSLGVHGKSAPVPVTPETPYRPENAYARSKVAAEAALADLTGRQSFDLVTLRPPMIYGPRGNNSFAKLARLVKTGLPLPLAWARGRRSFCSVENAVSAIIHSAMSKKVAPVLIPADPEDFDTVGLVNEMSRVMERDVRLWPLPKACLAIPLGMVGRGEMATSLFDPLQVDRAHWQTQAWRPVESGAEGVRRALLGAAK
jgi:nucleoside-diphosphate-sugar epimerase